MDCTGDIPKILPKNIGKVLVSWIISQAVEIDTQNLKNKQGFSTTFTTNWEFYEETFLSVVSETIYR